MKAGNIAAIEHGRQKDYIVRVKKLQIFQYQEKGLRMRS